MKLGWRMCPGPGFGAESGKSRILFSSDMRTFLTVSQRIKTGVNRWLVSQYDADPKSVYFKVVMAGFMD